MVTFYPRFVIVNNLNTRVFYNQKGSDVVYPLPAGKRMLLWFMIVSVCVSVCVGFVCGIFFYVFVCALLSIYRQFLQPEGL